MCRVARPPDSSVTPNGSGAKSVENVRLMPSWSDIRRMDSGQAADAPTRRGAAPPGAARRGWDNVSLMTVTMKPGIWRGLAALTLVAAAACGGRASTAQQAQPTTAGDPQKGVEAIRKYGCGACHTIPGVKGADATIGPPLDNIASRQILGGHLQNTPENMARWIQHPQRIDPKNAMPELGVTDGDVRDIVAYLYTLK